MEYEGLCTTSSSSVIDRNGSMTVNKCVYPLEVVTVERDQFECDQIGIERHKAARY